MNSVKIGTLVIASMFTLNSFGQQEKVGETRKVETAEISKKEKLTPEEIATKQTEKLDKKLSLTEEQKALIYDVNLKVINKNQAVRENDSLSKKFKQDSYAGNNGIRDNITRAALTDEQKVIWDKMQEEKAAKKANHHGHDHDEHDGHSH